MNDLATYVRIRINALVKSERGASAVEYGLLVALIAIIIIAAVSLLGGNLSEHLQQDRQQHRVPSSRNSRMATTPLAWWPFVVSVRSTECVRQP